MTQIIPANQVADHIMEILDQVIEQEFTGEAEQEAAKARILEALAVEFFH